LFSQTDQQYYVTIGVFANPNNANRLVDKATKQGYSPAHSVRTLKKLNYVYILKTTDKRKAYAQAIKLRVETEYKDAWVFDGTFDDTPVAIVLPPPVKEEPVVEIKPIEKTPEPAPAIDSAALVKPIEVIEKPVEAPVVAKPTGKAFYFKLINGADGSEVKSGEVHLQESAKDTQFQVFKPGEIVYLETPKNKRGSYTVVTQVAGYGNISTVFDYENPAGEVGSGNEVIIEVPVTKAKKGDYIDFNNVKFFKNASILLPASQTELDGVVDLLKENPKYKIKIHGHVNGTYSRDSFTRGEKSEFFATNVTVDKITKNMSAKDLSTARAESISDYLISQSIEADRISVKGEGGKISIYPEQGSLGVLNDRIEIEFVKH
jgi:outer membrane protein OmpA-like peptidoglycan-associated protein